MIRTRLRQVNASTYTPRTYKRYDYITLAKVSDELKQQLLDYHNAWGLNDTETNRSFEGMLANMRAVYESVVQAPDVLKFAVNCRV